MARMNITVSDELRKRMDQVADRANWSSIAAGAYIRELRLLEAATMEDDKMNAVVERLRASKQTGEEEEYEFGYTTGTNAAKEYMEYHELARLEGLEVAGEPNAPWGWSHYIAFQARGIHQDQYDLSEAEEFWGDTLSGLESEDWFRGFVEGAQAIFKEVNARL